MGNNSGVRLTVDDKAEKFITEYIKDMNGTQAAIRAGYEAKYADRTASNLLKKPLIAAKINGLLKEKGESVDITPEWILRNLKDIAIKCTEDGERFNPNAAVKSLELMGKHIGMFNSVLKLEVSHSNFINRIEDYANMIDGEYREI